MNLDLRERWLGLEGESNLERLLYCWRTGRAWRARRLWAAEPGDGRPDLRGIDLYGVCLAGVDLSDTRLDEATFDDVDLGGARLCRSSLSGASFTAVVALGVDALAASCVGASFQRSTFAGTTFVAANLARTTWREVSLRDADLRAASFDGAELLACRFEGARLAQCDLDGTLIAGARGLVATIHDRDQFDALSPVFAPLLRLYPRLLHELSAQSQKVATGCLLASARPAAEVRGLLLDDDWRTTVAGAAAAVALDKPDAVCDALWHALERGSWAAPQLAGAAFLVDRRFDERAAEFLAKGVAPSGPGLPVKSLASVAGVVGGETPAALAAAPEAEAASRIAYAWVQRSEWASRRPQSAVAIARIMAANMKANQADPDFDRRRGLEDERATRKVLTKAGMRYRWLAYGPYAKVGVTGKEGQPVVVKEARAAVDASAAGDPFFEEEALFTTGLIVTRDPDPNEMLRCEAQALAVLAPATPRPIESGVRASGCAFVVRPYVEGESWRAILRRGESVDVAALRRLVELLATIEETTSLGFHGDVKPDNVIATWAGDVVLIDPTSAYARRVVPGGMLERALLTAEYNPGFRDSDRPALALTMIEMLTGCQLIADAADRPPRPIGPRLRESLRFSAATGTDHFLKRLPSIRLPSELLPALAGPAEALLLRALGLSVDNGVLDVGAPLRAIRELTGVLDGLDRLIAVPERAGGRDHG